MVDAYEGLHGSSGPEDDHGPKAEEEVCYQRDNPDNALLRGPPKPYQSAREDRSSQHSILPHPIFGLEDELPRFVVSACSSCLPVHDGVRPSAANDRGSDIAKRAWDIGKAHYDYFEIVWWLRESLLNSHIEYVERSESDAGEVHSCEDCGKAKIPNNTQRVNYTAFEYGSSLFCVPLYGLPC